MTHDEKTETTRDRVVVVMSGGYQRSRADRYEREPTTRFCLRIYGRSVKPPASSRRTFHVGAHRWPLNALHLRYQGPVDATCARGKVDISAAYQPRFAAASTVLEASPKTHYAPIRAATGVVQLRKALADRDTRHGTRNGGDVCIVGRMSRTPPAATSMIENPR